MCSPPRVHAGVLLLVLLLAAVAIEVGRGSSVGITGRNRSVCDAPAAPLRYAHDAQQNQSMHPVACH